MHSVSVVIPVYNGRRFVGKALQSAAAQSVRPLEIIVVDDGSNDDTRMAVEAFATDIPVKYQRQEHRGAGAARNFGVSLARGDWIAFLDADDLWHPEKLAVQCRCIDDYPASTFFYSDVDLVDESGHLIRERWADFEFAQKKPNSRQRLSRLIFGGRPFPLPSTVLMKRDLFDQTGGFNSAFGGKYHEDFELFARLAQTVSMHFISQSLAQHRRHGAQSAAEAASDRKNWLIFLNCLWQIWQERPRKQAALAGYFAKYYGDEGKRCLRSGDYLNARRYCRIAASYRPYNPTNLRHWGLCFMPVLRELYTSRSSRRKVSGRRSG